MACQSYQFSIILPQCTNWRNDLLVLIARVRMKLNFLVDHLKLSTVENLNQIYYPNLKTSRQKLGKFSENF